MICSYPMNNCLAACCVQGLQHPQHALRTVLHTHKQDTGAGARLQDARQEQAQHRRVRHGLQDHAADAQHDGHARDRQLRLQGVEDLCVSNSSKVSTLACSAHYLRPRNTSSC